MFISSLVKARCCSVSGGNLFWEMWFYAELWKDRTGNPESAASPGVLRGHADVLARGNDALHVPLSVL